MFIIIALVTACSGGGSGSTPTPATYTITSTTGAHGTITPLGTTNVTQGNSQGYTMVSDSGYQVDALTVDGNLVPSANSYTFANVQGNHTIAVAYALIPPPQTYSISGSVTGGVQAGVTVTLSPGGTTKVTASNGTYSYTGVLNGGYTVTPSLAGHTFTPVNASVTVNGADVTGVNFTTPVPVLAVGKLLYPSQESVSVKDLSTGAESYVYGSPGYNVYPDTIVTYRAGPLMAVIGSNLPGVYAIDLAPSSIFAGAINGAVDLAPYCPAWPADYPAVSFDISPLGDFAVMASNCTPPGLPARTDIFLVLMDGSNFWARVTDDVDADSQPVILGVDTATGYVTVGWIRNGTEIRKQVINPVPDPAVLVGPQTIVASNVMKGVRSMSVNSAYTYLAFMKNVGGVSHITVVPLAGGAEVDLGVGTDPYWSLDGSNLIMYTDQNALWVMNPDGTGKMSVPIPSNLQHGLGKVVFGPAGY